MRELRLFTVEELVEAGRELGVDADTVHEIYREHARDEQQAPGRPRPFDSPLALVKSGDTLSLVIPPSISRKGQAVFQLVACTGLVGFLAANAQWGLAAAGTTVAVLISYLSVRQATTTRELRLRRDGSGFLIRHVAGRSRGIPLRAGQVRARLAEREVVRKHSVRRISYLAIDHGVETYELLEGFSHPEHPDGPSLSDRPTPRSANGPLPPSDRECRTSLTGGACAPAGASIGRPP